MANNDEEREKNTGIKNYKQTQCLHYYIREFKVYAEL